EQDEHDGDRRQPVLLLFFEKREKFSDDPGFRHDEPFLLCAGAPPPAPTRPRLRLGAMLDASRLRFQLRLNRRSFQSAHATLMEAGAAIMIAPTATTMPHTTSVIGDGRLPTAT